MRCLWIVVAATQLYLVTHVLVSFALAWLRKSKIKVVVYGIPTLVSFERAGVSWKLGLLPISAWTSAEGQRAETEIQLDAPRPEREEASAHERERAAMHDEIVQRSAWGLVSTAAQLVVGSALAGPKRGVFLFFRTFATIFSEVWPPWSSGAATLERAFAALEQVSFFEGIGLVIITLVAGGLCSSTLNNLMISRIPPVTVRVVCGLGQFLLLASWLVALVYAVKGA